VDGSSALVPVFQPRLVSALTASCPAGINSSFQWGTINPDSLLGSAALQVMIAKQTDSDLLLIGIVEAKVNSSKAQYNIYTAKFQGRMKLVDPATSSVIWEASFPNDLIRDVQSTAGNASDAATAALSLKNQKKPTPDTTAFNRLSDIISAAMK